MVLDDASDQAIGRLIQSTEDDAPSDGARRRAMAALGIGGAVASVSGTASGAAAGAAAVSVKAAALGVAKWVVIGVTGAALAMGVARYRQSRDREALEPPHATPGSVTTDVVVPVAAPSTPLAPAAEAPSNSDRTEPPAAPRAREVKREQPPDETLADEVAALAEVRHDLATHDGAAALRLLDRYHHAYRRPSLGPEATLLRVEALCQVGRRGQALALARKLVASPGGAAYSKRLGSLLPELETNR
jgi:hypothetical protein